MPDINSAKAQNFGVMGVMTDKCYVGKICT
jgi:hypothetical protein